MVSKIIENQNIKQIIMKSPLTVSLRKQTPISKKAIPYMTSNKSNITYMNNFQIGDKVSVLDEAIDGKVIEVKNNEITIETLDGFLMKYSVNELVPINI